MHTHAPMHKGINIYIKTQKFTCILRHTEAYTNNHMHR